MNRNVYEVVPGGATTEKRNIGHVTYPGYGHPYCAMAQVAKSFADIGPRKTVLYKRTVERVIWIVKAKEPKAYALRKDS